MGGGRDYFLPKRKPGGRRDDGQDMMSAFAWTVKVAARVIWSRHLGMLHYFRKHHSRNPLLASRPKPIDAEVDVTGQRAALVVDEEKVELSDLSNGTRLSARVRRGKSGEVAPCGAAALLIKPGSRLTIASFGWMKEKAASKHEPLMVRVDDENRLLPAKKSKGD